MRRITKARIKFLSLCPKGANRLPVLYKEDGAFEIQSIVKATDSFDEKGELLCVVYAPELRDSQGDIADANVIKEMMYAAAKEGMALDVRHDGKALSKEQAFVAESFIVQKSDPRFTDTKDYEGNAVDVAGSWATVIKIDDPELRQLYRKGEWQGVSMAGVGHVQMEKADSAATKLLQSLAGLLGLKNSGDIDMTGDELKKALADNNTELAKTLGETIVKALKPADPPAPATKDDKGLTAPIFKGDPTKLEDVEAHEKALAQYELTKSVDWTKPESVAAYKAKLAEISKAASDGKDAGDGKGADDGKQETDEVKKLRLEKENAERRLAEVQKRSNQSATDPTNASLTKEDQECLAAAKAMTAYLNKDHKAA